MMIFTLMGIVAHSQIKVFSDGKTFVGDNTTITSPAEQLEVDGKWQAEGGTFESTGSALLKFNRINNSSMLMGVGGQTGFTFDQAYSFEIRKSNRAAILANGLGTGSVVMKIRGADGHTAFGFNSASGFHRAIFNGTIQANGVTLPSDKRLKKDVTTYNRGLSELMEINPISYKYNGKADISNTEMTHIGLFAQELQQIAPELVRSEKYLVSNENDDEEYEEYLSINDTGIKYLIINSVQEQQDIIENQNKIITSLEDEISIIKEQLDKLVRSNTGIDLDDDNSSAELKQNVPNPFGSTTEIEYSLPKSAEDGKIEVYNSNGQVIKTVRLSSGKGTIDVNNNSLSSGNYFYRMIVDGKVIDTKKMTVAN